jgi:hypothetical protein
VRALSNDHTPSYKDERQRIEKAGFEVIEEQTSTREGKTRTISYIVLNQTNRITVSRAFGYFDYKSNNQNLDRREQAILVDPEIIIHHRDRCRDLYLVLASDGIFDVMTNDDVGKFIVNHVKRLRSNGCDSASVLPKVGDLLLEHCLKIGSTDNMSVLIAALQQYTNKSTLKLRCVDSNKKLRKIQFTSPKVMLIFGITIVVSTFFISFVGRVLIEFSFTTNNNTGDDLKRGGAGHEQLVHPVDLNARDLIRENSIAYCSHEWSCGPCTVAQGENDREIWH